jgi:hypothetical protein
MGNATGGGWNDGLDSPAYQPDLTSREARLPTTALAAEAAAVLAIVCSEAPPSSVTPMLGDQGSPRWVADVVGLHGAETGRYGSQPVGALTTSTGHSAPRKMRCVVLPMMSSPTGLRLRIPITTSSGWISGITARIAPARSGLAGS